MRAQLQRIGAGEAGSPAGMPAGEDQSRHPGHRERGVRNRGRGSARVGHLLPSGGCRRRGRGNLAALIGVDGSGLLTTGSRVATVAELSGPSKLTAAGLGLGTTRQAFQQVELDYLGCAGFGDCPQARAASPRYHVDESDPLFFIGRSLDERIPKPQSDSLVAALRKAGVDTDYVTVKGDRHSIAMLTPELRSRIVASLHTQLGN